MPTTTQHETVADLVARQQRRFRTGETLPRERRLRLLEILRQAVQSVEPAVIAAAWEDLRKGEFEAYTTEVALVYEEIRFTRRHLRRWMRPRRVGTPIVHAPARSRIRFRPHGVSAIMSPWNYPFQLAIAPVVSAIAAGNTAIVKPSEFAPATAEVIDRMISDNFDPEILACVTGDGEVAAELTAAPVDHIFFTGSTRIGRKVMQTAADRITPVTLELGGKSPAIVTERAAIGVAARRIAWGKLLNAGQTCVAPDYVLVQRSAAEEFIRKLEQTVASFFPVGVKASPEYGRIVNDAHVERLSDILERQRAVGQPVFGGEIHAEDRFIAPTAFYPAAWEDPVMEDELFGPILPIIPYDSLEEAFDAVRSRPKPLAAYLFTGDRDEKRRFQETVPFGGATINDTVVHLTNPRLPFGGTGLSGMGSYHGFAGFRAFSHEASVMERGTWLDLPLKYPPYGKALGLVRRIMGP